VTTKYKIKNQNDYLLKNKLENSNPLYIAIEYGALAFTNLFLKKKKNGILGEGRGHHKL